MTLSSTTSYQYDSFGRLAGKQQGVQGNGTSLDSHSVGYQYGTGRLLQQLTTPKGAQIGYQWDKARLIGITLNGTPLLTNITSNALGQITTWNITVPGGATQSIQRSFDADGRMSQSSLHAYTYDGASRITQITGRTGTSAASESLALTYDTRDRLTQFGPSAGGSGTRTFAYDANGNRTSSKHTQGSTTTTTTNTIAADSNRLTKTGTQTVVNDAAGNTIHTAAGQTLIHDPSGRVSALYWQSGADAATGQMVHYVHNAEGQRLFKSAAQPSTTGGASNALSGVLTQ